MQYIYIVWYCKRKKIPQTYYNVLLYILLIIIRYIPNQYAVCAMAALFKCGLKPYLRPRFKRGRSLCLKPRLKRGLRTNGWDEAHLGSGLWPRLTRSLKPYLRPRLKRGLSFCLKPRLKRGLRPNGLRWGPSGVRPMAVLNTWPNTIILGRAF